MNSASEQPARHGVADAPRTLARAARTVAATLGWISSLGLASGGLIWLVLFAGWLGRTALHQALSITALGILLLPAAGSGLAALLTRQLIALPHRVEALPRQVAATLQEARSSLEGKRGAERLLGAAALLWKALWALRSGHGLWLRAAGLARLAKLASLPVLVFLAAAVALCLLLIGFAAVVLVARLLTVLL